MEQASQQLPTPPSCSDCATKTQPAGASAPKESVSRMWRSSTGNMRIDTPNTSVITNPGAQKAILLDHLKKEAMVIPMLPASGGAHPGSPQMPGGIPQPPHVQVQDLGKSLIEGHEVEGKRFTLPPVPVPKLPAMPQMPKMSEAPALPGVPKPPQAAGLPTAPKLPQAPKPPELPKVPPLPKVPVPTVTEIWTSVKLKIPVLTKVTSSAGEHTTYCKPTSTAEPHPSLFEIPPGYKLKSS